MIEQEIKEIVGRFRPGRETLPEKQTILRLIEEIDRLNLRNREIDKMSSILIQYIHDLKRHQASIQFCKEEPCPATLEFLAARKM